MYEIVNSEFLKGYKIVKICEWGKRWVMIVVFNVWLIMRESFVVCLWIV